MGEHIQLGNNPGIEIKIGTCEDLYYARYDDLIKNFHQLYQLSGNESPSGCLDEKNGFRYRFPFPDEDNNGIGNYDNYNRGYMFTVPFDFAEEHEHMNICVSTSAKGAYNVNQFVKCPADKSWVRTCSDRGDSAPFEIVQQKQVGGKLWVVYRCGWCGAMYRADVETAARLCQAIKNYHRFDTPSNKAYAREIIRRIITGYKKLDTNKRRSIISPPLSMSPSYIH